MSTPSQVEAIFLAALDMKDRAGTIPLSGLRLRRRRRAAQPGGTAPEGLSPGGGFPGQARRRAPQDRPHSIQPRPPWGLRPEPVGGARQRASGHPEAFETLADPHDEDEDNTLAVLEPSKQARLAGPSGTLRGPGGARQGQLRDRREGARRQAPAVRRHQAHVHRSWPRPRPLANDSCARRGRPRPSAIRTSSPSTPSRTSPSPTW